MFNLPEELIKKSVERKPEIVQKYEIFTRVEIFTLLHWPKLKMGIFESQEFIKITKLKYVMHFLFCSKLK